MNSNEADNTKMSISSKQKCGGSAPVLLGRKRKQDAAAAAVAIQIQDKRSHVVVGEVQNHKF